MNNKVTFIALAAAAATLSACGGSGTTVNTAPTYAELVARADTAAAGVVDLSTGDVTGGRDDVPNSGTASYTGYVKGDLDSGGTLIGELSLDANFSGGTVTGSATNFQHSTKDAYTGSLTLSGGTITDSGVVGTADTFGGSLDGTLSNGGTDYTTSILLDGEFVGGSGATLPDNIAGYADGTLDDGVTNDAFTGAFITTQTP
ncbi:hypothetical protein BMI91_14770 [Thioclava sediminum]|uniref:Transferrin-binding protein B C-lobe/N-lobe beta barrel domain-containing protein n=1 Tax=Thioclava sediminum TaxID=1915319 RepID=A0ABX3MVL5_9RHOB|nr:MULTISPECIES: hypothetical protein [Thioclava]MAQ36790.1 hypothetical protein [Thioclava sp.]OOY05211.1 hypothetical protein BMI87_09375 [Thioclava sp. F28-4]OOY08636.1 hypothetical protein BMI89_10720 [Thioclava sp. F36-7]OOY15968.1 hypothetical protein BMI85_10545 [Thioclava sp. DLFJ4-1]OOY23725.1 hypothetical protein BMI91_14770 [Thioclava sediminum]